MVVAIRRAAVEDASAISAVLRAAFSPYKTFYTPAGFAATTPDAEHVRARMAEGFMWVAADGDEVVGTIGAHARGQDFHLRGMAVLPAANGCGVGRRLLAHAEAAAWLGGHTRMGLSTTPFLTRAITLYERIGFLRCDEPPYDLKGTPLISMVKVLRPPVPVDLATAEHDVWAAGGEGWHLLKRPDLSVIYERMAPGAADAQHFHECSRQVLVVCAGTATIDAGSMRLTLAARQSLELPPGLPHAICNEAEAALEFLLISWPPAMGDRIPNQPTVSRST